MDENALNYYQLTTKSGTLFILSPMEYLSILEKVEDYKFLKLKKKNRYIAINVSSIDKIEQINRGRIGDSEVKIDDPKKITGTIVEVNHIVDLWSTGFDEWKYVVKFDDEKLIPPKMEYENDQLVAIKSSYSKACECGAIFTDFPDIHLQYCPKSEK